MDEKGNVTNRNPENTDDVQRRLVKQNSRLEEIKVRNRKTRSQVDAKDHHEHIKHNVQQICNVAWGSYINAECNMSEQLQSTHEWNYSTIMSINVHISNLQKVLAERRANMEETNRDKLHGKLADAKTRYKTLMKMLSSAAPQPLTCLLRPDTGPQGQRPGSYTMSPSEVDSITQDAWQTIYEGNAACITTLIDKFFKRFAKLTPEQTVQHVDATDPQRIMDVCTAGNKSAKGPDQWSPAEFGLLSYQAFVQLSKMLNAIEEEANWPGQVLHCTAAFLTKDEGDRFNPLAHRVLLIAPTLYRKWATLRLDDMDDWINTWSHPAMMVGVKGRGAEDGWWNTSLNLELSHTSNEAYTGGAIDVYKCFDQIVPQLLHEMARRKGMPPTVLQAYISFQKHIKTRNSISGGLGSPYSRKCCIPQGCPFSMMFTALMLEPWIITMEQKGVGPRVLADDLLIVAHGKGHGTKFKQALDESHMYLQMMGARIPPNKSTIISSVEATTNWLRTHVWKNLETGATIKIVTQMRDLGAHISTGVSSYATTLQERMREATILLYKVSKLPMDFKQRASIIRTRVVLKCCMVVKSGN